MWLRDRVGSTSGVSRTIGHRGRPRSRGPFKEEAIPRPLQWEGAADHKSGHFVPDCWFSVGWRTGVFTVQLGAKRKRPLLPFFVEPRRFDSGQGALVSLGRFSWSRIGRAWVSEDTLS